MTAYCAMDDSVLQAMAKWPDVPDCFGWLRLDARGRWHVPSGILAHPHMVDFIGRNYARDDQGRWYFQNGPQRVFVDLEYTPRVYRLRGEGIEDHTGQPILSLHTVYLDEYGSVVLQADDGFGVLDDRDLGTLVHHEDGNQALEHITLQQRVWPLQPIMRKDVAVRGSFVPRPRDPQIPGTSC